MRIPLSSPDITGFEAAAASRVLTTPRLSLGPKLEEFESAMRRYTGAECAVAVSSGTAALHIALRAFGIGEGDEVIIPSFAFVAIANAVLYEKAVPVFVDIEPETLNISPEKVEVAITPRTRAILVVHTFGFPAEISEIMGIARRRRLRVIEDACEALGAEACGQKIGTFGDAGAFAFYPNKQITTGEGGALVTNHEDIARRARILRNQGRDTSKGWLDHVELGYSYRLPEINCALGVEQLRRIDSILEQRAAIAQGYDRRLCGNPDIHLPPLRLRDRQISWFAYVVRLSERYGQAQRDWIWREMNGCGIGCGRYFAPIHLQPACRRSAPVSPDSLSITMKVASRTLALPFFNRLSEPEMDEVSETLCGLLARAKGMPG